MNPTAPAPDNPDPERDLADEAIERRLRLRFARARNGACGGCAECPSANRLAALIDGTGDQARRDETERHVAGCSACTDAVAECRALIAAQVETPMAAPAEVVARARMLMRDVPGPVVVRRVGFLALVPTLGRWGLSAAASIAVCLLGYQAGARSSAATSAEPDLVAELTFGVDLDGATELDLLLDDASSESGVEVGS